MRDILRATEERIGMNNRVVMSQGTGKEWGQNAWRLQSPEWGLKVER